MKVSQLTESVSWNIGRSGHLSQTVEQQHPQKLFCNVYYFL